METNNKRCYIKTVGINVNTVSFSKCSATHLTEVTLIRATAFTYWNARNQLTTISGSTTASFSYDSFGRRIGKTINGQTTSYLYDGSNVVREQGNGSSINLLNGGLDEVFTRSEETSQWSPLRDGLGSTLALADGAGSVQSEYAYGSFGGTTNTGANNSNASQYTARENDGTGLYFLRGRYYSSTLQRFISEDPIGMAGGINLYAYVGNNPISYSDPFGTDKNDWGWWALCHGAQISAGFGDRITFGATSWFRTEGGNRAVDPNSDSYKIGSAFGDAWFTAGGIALTSGGSVLAGGGAGLAVGEVGAARSAPLLLDGLAPITATEEAAFNGIRSTATAILDGQLSRSALTEAQLSLAAKYYIRAGFNPKGSYSAAIVSAYQFARASYLLNGGTPPGKFLEFMSNNF